MHSITMIVEALIAGDVDEEEVRAIDSGCSTAFAVLVACVLIALRLAASQVADAYGRESVRVCPAELADAMNVKPRQSLSALNALVEARLLAPSQFHVANAEKGEHLLYVVPAPAYAAQRACGA